MVGLSWGLWIYSVRESWIKELDDWVCWRLSGGSELETVFRQAEGDLGQEVG